MNRTRSTRSKQLISRNKGSLNKAKHQSNDSSSRGTNIILHITVKNFINKVYAQFIKFTLRIITWCSSSSSSSSLFA